MSERPRQPWEGECRSCGAAIVWAIGQSADGRMIRYPIDPAPIAGGNIELETRGQQSPLVHFHPPEPGKPRYRSHFATCPDAARWRRVRVP